MKDTLRDPITTLLRDPVTGENFIKETIVRRQGMFVGEIGILRSSSREVPVVAGIPIFQKHLASAMVMTSARRGNLLSALYWVLKAETGSTRTACRLLLRLKLPSSLQSNGSPFGLYKKEVGKYFRYRYSVPNVPAVIGVLSCLNRASTETPYLLDVGAGFGHFYQYYLHSYPPERIVLQDLSFQQLLVASCFVGKKSLLVCSSADEAWPFAKNQFTDIISFNAFAYIKDKKLFQKRAIECLNAMKGTMWLTNNWNQKITDKYTGISHSPSEWQEFCDSDKWRMFPDKHFSDAVLNSDVVNLAVRYRPQDEDPYYRAVTLAYSNHAWGCDNKFVPLNRASKLQNLNLNPIYRISSFGKLLIKRQVKMKLWDAHINYYGFYLPVKVNLSDKLHNIRGQELMDLAEKCIMVESLGVYRRSFISNAFATCLERFGVLLNQSNTIRRLKPLMPDRFKAFVKKLFFVP